jgi:hypothetical protein
LILVVIFTVLRFGAQKKKKPFIAPKFSAKIWSAKNFTLHSLVLNFGKWKEKKPLDIPKFGAKLWGIESQKLLALPSLTTSYGG